MKKKIDSLSTNQQSGELTSIISKFRVVLMGNDFQPLPSYWALIPVNQANMLRLKKK